MTETVGDSSVSVDKRESVARAIVQLNPQSARAKRIVAAVTIGIPGVGFVVACYLVLTGRATGLDYILFAVFYAIQMFGITIGFHRYAAHKSFKTSRTFEGILMIAGSMAMEGPLLFWVITHRRHHRFADELGDPHSPNLSGSGLGGKLRGLWYAHIPWMFSTQESRVDVFAPDILRDRRLFFYNRTYFLWALIGLVLPALAGLLIGGTWSAAFSGFIFGGLARVFLANQAAWCVGSVSHMIGSRPFVTKDDSANNWPVAIATFGEGLQNNHHAFPGAYKHGMRWWEPDLSGRVLTVLGKMRIVWDLRMPDRNAINDRLRRNSATALSN
ncbi:acyl-CoA desaturase [Rhodococcus sp. ABRD24]|uniref:acyl-CoA desaturase n=1 Tax=Rhodococcus sp. ABRD24 TaxID=2507582 RepID=UPI00103FDEC6|nr:fatty acid desaturase [Rhodococcus sp. ABRD24]QBJ98120.1 acyl-CoA desaturase [Rhodococcus sp. ABRD24]